MCTSLVVVIRVISFMALIVIFELLANSIKFSSMASVELYENGRTVPTRFECSAVTKQCSVDELSNDKSGITIACKRDEEDNENIICTCTMRHKKVQNGKCELYIGVNKTDYCNAYEDDDKIHYHDYDFDYEYPITKFESNSSCFAYHRQNGDQSNIQQFVSGFSVYVKNQKLPVALWVTCNIHCSSNAILDPGNSCSVFLYDSSCTTKRKHKTPETKKINQMPQPETTKESDAEIIGLIVGLTLGITVFLGIIILWYAFRKTPDDTDDQSKFSMFSILSLSLCIPL